LLSKRRLRGITHFCFIYLNRAPDPAWQQTPVRRDVKRLIPDKEATMKLKHVSILSATAVAFLSLSGAAQAGGLCSNATLKGPFSFIGHGEILGLKKASDGSFHPYAAPSILDDVALVTFDGRGGLQRTDFGMIGGLPKGGSTAFNPVQHGYYTVNSDCTGIMKIIYDQGGSVPAGVETDLNIVVADDGTLVESVVYRAVTVSGSSMDGQAVCPSDCEQGVQESFEGKKVVVYGFHESSQGGNNDR
jgi:hypothetical protein